MRTLKVFLAFFFCCFFSYQHILATPVPDSCLKLFCEGFHPDTLTIEQCSNPDSVKIDTCSSTVDFGHRYATKWFRVEFRKLIFFIPAASNVDTIIDRRWRDIDTSDIALRAGFDSVEVHFGTFVLQKAYPTESDTSSLAHLLQSQVFLLKFDNYVDIDSAQTLLKTIDSINTYYQNRALIALGIYENVEKKVATELIIQPNPASNKIKITRRDNQPINHIELFNVLGKKVYERNIGNTEEVEIDTHSLPDGLYIANCDALKAMILVSK
jgi:hypothetical protein